MAPSAIDTPMPPLPVREEKKYPPARIYNVKETKFEEYVAPQPDGREKALARSEGETAIVIDNGLPAHSQLDKRS
jgi:actin-related protein 5